MSRVRDGGPVPVRAAAMGTAILALGVGFAVPAGAQPMSGTRCRPVEWALWDGTQLSDTDRVETFVDVTFVCDGDQRIEADSAVIRSPRGRSELLGNVVIREGTETLRAAAADYYLEDGRLVARGGVHVEDRENGREIRGDALSRLPPVDYRPYVEVTVTGRPAVATLPSASREGELDVVRALRIVLEGEEDFRAYSQVEVERDSLDATADSMWYSETAGALRLSGNAHMVGTQGEFRGATIALGLAGGEVESIRVVGDGVLLADDLDLRSEEIRVELPAGEMERLVAVRGEGAEAGDGIPPPYAVTAGFFLTGDSIDALAPGGVLALVDAVGSAWGQTVADSGSVPDPGLPPSERLREGPLTADRLTEDWIEGGAIRIEFDDGPVRDGARERVARRLRATEGGRALYRTPPDSETTPGDRSTWPIEYVIASALVLHLTDDGEVDRIEATGGMSGAHLEPIPAPAAPAADPAPGGTP